MKKLIAILVVFAMVTGATFAADIGADAFGMIDVVKGSTQEDSDPATNMAITRARLSASAEDENGIFGGWIRFDTPNDWGAGGNVYGNGVVAYGNMWWKPLDVLKLQIGTNGGDGEFELAGGTTWGFYQVAGDVRTIDAGNAWGGGYWDEAGFRSAFYGGFNDGAILFLTPVEGLSINIGIPYPYSWGDKAEDVYKQTVAQFSYNAEGIGTFGLTYRGGVMDDEVLGDSAKLFVYAGLSMVENMGIDIGIGYEFGEELKDVQTISYPISAALGVNFSSDAFGVKFRAMGQFGGSVKIEAADKTYDIPMVVLVDVMPYVNISDTLIFNFSAGIKMFGKDDNDGFGLMSEDNSPSDAVTGWHIHPYITVKSAWWAPNFYAGLRIESDGKKDADDKTYINWSVPIGIAFSF